MNIIAACRADETRTASLRILSEMGLNVHEARSGQHAAEMLDVYNPDVILLEADPHGQEIQFCRKLRKEQRYAGMIAVWVTPPYSAAEWLENGANAFIQHSSDDAILTTTLRALLRARSAERELASANDQLESLHEALRHSRNDFQQFARRASHDFQESLRAITVFSQLMAQEPGASQRGPEQQYFSHVLAGTQRMRALLDSILLYSQVASEAPVTYGMVDLDRAVQGVLKTLQESIATSGARVEVDPALPSVWANLLGLLQVFQNLIGNAIAYRRPDRGLEVHIEAKRSSSGGWLIFVRDNGMGIDKQYHESIFAPFKRLHGREIPGSGLGLAICRRIVETHGGRITVESSSSEGSTFLFSLPDAPL